MIHDRRSHEKRRSRRCIAFSSPTGSEYPIEAVGERLREELARSSPPGRDPIVLVRARCANSPEAQRTLDLLLRSAGADLRRGPDPAEVTNAAVDVSTCDELTAAVDQDPMTLETFVRGLRTAVSGGGAILLVGHQPQLSRIADE